MTKRKRKSVPLSLLTCWTISLRCRATEKQDQGARFLAGYRCFVRRPFVEHDEYHGETPSWSGPFSPFQYLRDRRHQRIRCQHHRVWPRWSRNGWPRLLPQERNVPCEKTNRLRDTHEGHGHGAGCNVSFFFHLPWPTLRLPMALLILTLYTDYPQFLDFHASPSGYW